MTDSTAFNNLLYSGMTESNEIIPKSSKHISMLACSSQHSCDMYNEMMQTNSALPSEAI